jgi:hypothetical protein
LGLYGFDSAGIGRDWKEKRKWLEDVGVLQSGKQENKKTTTTNPKDSNVYRK